MAGLGEVVLTSLYITSATLPRIGTSSPGHRNGSHNGFAAPGQKGEVTLRQPYRYRSDPGFSPHR